jgi:hypothetical protein
MVKEGTAVDAVANLKTSKVHRMWVVLSFWQPNLPVELASMEGARATLLRSHRANHVVSNLQ